MITSQKAFARLILQSGVVAIALLVSSLRLCGQSAVDSSLVVPLWNEVAPGSEGKTGDEHIRVTDTGEHVISNVHRPSITIYLPETSAASGAAVLVIPGGGHREIWIDHEGHNIGRWLAAHGIAAFVLKYRLAREPASTYSIEGHSLIDAQRALRLIRQRSKEWGVDPARLGVMGFSAGGEIAALASMNFEAARPDENDLINREISKPAFQALIYPGNARGIEPKKDSPPAFLVCGYEDRPEISLGLAEAYIRFKKTDVPAELHIYSDVGHGFGLRATNHGAYASWPDRLYEWLEGRGFLKKPAQSP